MTFATSIEIAGTVASSDAIKGYALVKFWEAYPGIDYETKLPTTKHRLWAAWFDIKQEQLKEGDQILIAGELSCKVDTWTPKDATEPKNVVSYNLNNCTIKGHEPKALSEATEATTAPANVQDELEVPF
jgi:hypothetical protein